VRRIGKPPYTGVGWSTGLYKGKVQSSTVVLVHAMKAYGGLGVELHSFLTSALDGVQ
jgi:hypothetical protein